MSVRSRLIVVISSILVLFSCTTDFDKNTQGILFRDVYKDSICKFHFVYVKGGDYLAKYMTVGNCCIDSLENNRKFETIFLDSVGFLLKDSLSKRKIEIEYGCIQSLDKQLDFINRIDSLLTIQYGLKVETYEIEKDYKITIVYGENNKQ